MRRDFVCRGGAGGRAFSELGRGRGLVESTEDILTKNGKLVKSRVVF
jgi:hypothetical protein